MVQSGTQMVNKKFNNRDSTFYCDADHIALGLLSDEFVFDPSNEKTLNLETVAYTLRYWRDEFYQWKDGCWNRMSDAEIKRIVVEHIHNLNDRTVVYESQRIPITTQRINNILLCLKGRIGSPETTELNSWLDGREILIQTLSVKNGLLMLDRKKNSTPLLIEHTPRFFGVTKLPYDYDENAKCPQWETFLDDVMQNNQEYILLLQQWIGYLFRPDLREQKFLLCVGEGANGKGVFFEIVQELVGKKNCSQVSLSRFNNPFALYPTLGKVVNATNESSHIIEDEAETILKSFVAGDRFTFERKFKDPVYDVPTAKIMIATNALPRFNDKTQGIWRRMLLVPFDKTIPDELQIKCLANDLKKELPGILNWAIKGLQMLNEANGFTIPESSKELIEEYRRDADPARAFLLENYRASPNGENIPCSEVYEQYKQFCEVNKCRPMSNRIFGRQVRRVFHNIKRTRPGSGDSREWVYQGLTSQTSQEAFI